MTYTMDIRREKNVSVWGEKQTFGISINFNSISEAVSFYTDLGEVFEDL